MVLRNRNGFTLIEILVAATLLSVIILAAAQVHQMSLRAAKSSAAADEFNAVVSRLVVLVNSTSQRSGLPNQNPCTSAFLNMPIGPTGPIISVAQTLLPPPAPVAAFKSFIYLVPPPIGIFQNGAAGGIPIVQVGAPDVSSANPNYPPPKSNLWITDIRFTQTVDTNFISPPVLPPSSTWVPNLYLLQVDAKKVSDVNPTPDKIVGGETTFTKSILVTLWVSANKVVYCGGNPL